MNRCFLRNALLIGKALRASTTNGLFERSDPAVNNKHRYGKNVEDWVTRMLTTYSQKGMVGRHRLNGYCSSYLGLRYSRPL